MYRLMQGLTDAAFEAQFGTEALCFAVLLKARQAAGMPCPRCDNPNVYLCGRRVGCTRCDHRWSLTAGTVMHATKLPLRTWFRAMHIISSTKQGVSAIELGRRLGVSYATAWYLHKRLRHAMTERESRYRLGAPDTHATDAPVVEADDVYLGGERNEGSGLAGKTPVIVAAERKPQGCLGHVGMQVVEGFTLEAVAQFKADKIADKAIVLTDGLRAFGAFANKDCTHQVIRTGSKRPPRQRGAPFFTVNTVIANLKTALAATHKAISAKHTADYLGAFCWTTNRRHNMQGMIVALCRAVATSSNLTRREVYAA